MTWVQERVLLDAQFEEWVKAGYPVVRKTDSPQSTEAQRIRKRE
jgi:hypothetical protein